MKSESSYVGRIRARGGYAIDNFLLFVAGGVSFSNDSVSLTGIAPAGPPASISKNLVGWNIGAGVDWAFTPNWIARAEYVYDDYGSSSYEFNPMSGGYWQNKSISETDNTVRAALMYKF